MTPEKSLVITSYLVLKTVLTAIIALFGLHIFAMILKYALQLHKKMQ